MTIAVCETKAANIVIIVIMGGSTVIGSCNVPKEDIILKGVADIIQHLESIFTISEFNLINEGNLSK